MHLPRMTNECNFHIIMIAFWHLREYGKIRMWVLVTFMVILGCIIFVYVTHILINTYYYQFYFPCDRCSVHSWMDWMALHESIAWPSHQSFFLKLNLFMMLFISQWIFSIWIKSDFIFFHRFENVIGQRANGGCFMLDCINSCGWIRSPGICLSAASFMLISESCFHNHSACVYSQKKKIFIWAFIVNGLFFERDFTGISFRVKPQFEELAR